MNRNKQSKSGYTFDMLIFSCIRVKRIEREREQRSGGERRWRKRELKVQSPPQFTPA